MVIGLGEQTELREDPQREPGRGSLLISAGAFYAIGLISISRPLRAPIRNLLCALSVIGAVGMAAYGMDAIQRALFDSSIDGTSAAPFALRVPGLFFPLALLTLGIARVRQRLAAPRYLLTH